MTEDLQQKPTKASIENEAKNGLKNSIYSIAMARTMAPHSASSQFFINVADNEFLNYPGQDDWGYCVFGEVISGQEVVDKIQLVETTNLSGHADVPAEPIVINKAFIQE
jgi:peptidyl-prolyl cis-trans isomerase B (cyclophilin B)